MMQAERNLRVPVPGLGPKGVSRGVYHRPPHTAEEEKDVRWVITQQCGGERGQAYKVGLGRR